MDDRRTAGHRPASRRRRQAVLAPLIGETELRLRLAEMARVVSAGFQGDELVVVGLLKGSFMFMADLVRLLHQQGIPLIIDFMAVSSYGAGTASSGTVRLVRDLTTDIRGRHVMLVDDILDTGRTLTFTVEKLRQHEPAQLRTCVLLDKPSRRIVPFAADYVGFTVPDAFVVGYGLDFDNRYRELPCLSVIQQRRRRPRRRSGEC